MCCRTKEKQKDWEFFQLLWIPLDWIFALFPTEGYGSTLQHITVTLQHITVFIICRKRRKPVHFLPCHVEAPSFQKGLFYLFPLPAPPYIFSPQEPHNEFLLVKKSGFWLAEMSHDLLDVTVYGGGDSSFYEPVPSTLSPLSVSFQFFITDQVLAICIQWCPDFQISWATRTCTELVGSALKSGCICEQWPNCSVDNCTVSGWFPLLI